MDATLELAEAAPPLLELRGDAGTGWSMGREIRLCCFEVNRWVELRSGLGAR